MRTISIRYIFITVLLVELFFNFTGCTRRSLLEEVHPHSTDGLLRINLEWLGSSMPQSMRFYFYNKEGGEPFYREGTILGYEGYVPVGTYDIVICNPDIVGVNLRNNLGYEDAMVEANRLAHDISCIEHVDNIYGTGLKNVVVPPDVVKEETAIPQNLVKKLTIILKAETRKEVEKMEVSLSGAVLHKRIVDLYTSEETSNIKSNATYNQVENVFTTGISTLGFKGYCPFNVHLTFDDNEQASCFPLDLTDVLIFFPEEEKTLEYTLYLPNDEEIQMTVKVHQWKPGGGGEIIVQ